jgi:hypothetical protein
MITLGTVSKETMGVKLVGSPEPIFQQAQAL